MGDDPRRWLRARRGASARPALVLAVVAAAAVLALALSAPRADAHGEGTPTIRTLIDEIEPAPEGVRFQVLGNDVARLAATNRTDEDLLIESSQGEPFLRIGPRGTFANVSSPTWYASGNPDGIASAPDGVDLDGPPRWVKVSDEPEWTWFDHRLHPADLTLPQEAIEAQRTARLQDWTVSATLGDEELEVRGHVEYQPILGAIEPRILSSAQPTPQLQVAILRGRLPGLFLINLGPRPVTVLGSEGEPFARIGPRGVEVNVLSPTHFDDRLARGSVPSMPADADASPQWRKVASQPRYAWLDTRAQYTRNRPPRDIAEGGREVVLRRWDIPLEVAGRSIAVRGTTSWVPSGDAVAARRGGDGGLSAVIPLGGVGALALAGALALRWRRRGRADAAAERELERVG